MKKYLNLSVAVLLGALTLTACSESNDSDNEESGFNIVKTAPLTDEDSATSWAANSSRLTPRLPRLSSTVSRRLSCTKCWRTSLTT